MTALQDNYRWPFALVLLGAALVLVVTLHAATFAHVVGVWNHWTGGEYYAHGYLVCLLSLYMIFQDRARLAALGPCPDAVALVALLFAMLMWLAGSLADVQLVTIVAILAMIMSIIWTLLGRAVAATLLFAVMIFLFALPVWSPLPARLQVLAADSAYVLARLAGIPALQQGQFIVLPAGSLEVAKSCSGLSYLLAALTLGVFYAWMYYRSIAGGIVVLLLAGLAAISANILRITILVYLGYTTGMTHPMIAAHFNLGWYLFGGIALVFMLVDAFLLRRRAPAPGGAPVADRTVPACDTGRARLMLVTGCMILLLVSAPLLVRQLDARQAGPTAMLQLPAGLGGWVGPVVSMESWQPAYQGAELYRQDYVHGGERVTLCIADYPRQVQGRELVNYRNSIADPENWRQTDTRQISAGGHTVYESMLQSRTGARRIVWYWYRVAGRNSLDPGMVKLYQLLGRLGGSDRAALVSIAAAGNDNVPAARERLRQFLELHGDTIMNSVDGY